MAPSASLLDLVAYCTHYTTYAQSFYIYCGKSTSDVSLSRQGLPLANCQGESLANVHAIIVSMERKVSFAPNEYYHIFSRGVEKRKIFIEKNDYSRFIALLYIQNQNGNFHFRDFFRENEKHKNLKKIFNEKRNKMLVSILSYSLMPNHFHFVIRENEDGGISKFMGKLLTGYSMYFNKKYGRSGPLFVRPFRSVHIDNDPQFMHIFSYVHLNPLDLIESGWKENGIKNIKKAYDFLRKYEYSSYPDYLGDKRLETKIIDYDESAPVSREKLDLPEYEKWYREYIDQ